MASLAFLSKAPSKAAVLRAFNLVFIHRDEAPGSRKLDLFETDFGLAAEEASDLFEAIASLISRVLFTGQVRKRA